VLKPLTNRVLIRPDVPPDETASGLVLPEARWKPENMGEILAVPERVEAHCPECGERVFVTPQVKVGDVVLFSTESGQELTINGERLLLMREADLLAVLESETV
jgi:chaperonin GroES